MRFRLARFEASSHLVTSIIPRIGNAAMNAYGKIAKNTEGWSTMRLPQDISRS
jgi:hypothetical protein